MSMMGGTALLDELLAEQAAGCSAASHDTGIREAAVVAPQLPVGMHRGDPMAPCPTPASNTAETRQDELLAAPPSPLSRQIEELAREMDDCLGSLGDQWEEEKRQHRQNLINKLEAQYGAENDFDASGESFYGSSCYMPRHGAIDSDKPDLISPFPEVASPEASLEATDEVLARLRDEDEVERCTDQARISSLRAEVEELRIKAAGGSVSFAPLNAVPLSIVNRPAYVAPGTPHPGLVLDASLSGLDATLGLQAWRDEVDAVLGVDDMCFEDELRGCSFDGDADPAGLSRMEGDLAGICAQVRLMEGVVASSSHCVEDELGELDQLLSECEDFHSRLRLGA